MTVNIHHVSIFVADMDRAIHLFRDILGFEMSWHIPEYPFGKLPDTGIHGTNHACRK